MPPKSHLLILSKCYFGGIIIFSPRKEHFIKLRRCWLGTKIAFAKDCTYVHMIRHSKAYQLTYHNWHHIWDEVYWIPILIFSEFQILESEFQFLDFSTAEFEKKNPTGIFGIKNGIVIPLPMGVLEIGTKNWNSQSSVAALSCKQRVENGWKLLMAWLCVIHTNNRNFLFVFVKCHSEVHQTHGGIPGKFRVESKSRANGILWEYYRENGISRESCLADF